MQAANREPRARAYPLSPMADVLGVMPKRREIVRVC